MPFAVGTGKVTSGTPHECREKILKTPKRYNMLFLNTYLLPETELPIKDYLDHVIGYAIFNLLLIPPPLEAINLLNLGSSKLCSVIPTWIGKGPFKVPNPLKAACLIHSVASLVTWILDKLDLEPIDLLKKLDISPSEIIDKLTPGDWNLDEVGIDWRVRAIEIGQETKRDYDILCFCETFETDVVKDEPRKRILAAWSEEPDYAVGPDSSGDYVSTDSGLLTIVAGCMTDSQKYQFSARGNRLKDSDAWANKGILLTEVDVGFGKIDIYNTHLYNGGGLPKPFPKPSEEAKNEIRLKQLQELVNFVNDTHKPENLIIIVGDLNVDAHDLGHELVTIKRRGTPDFHYKEGMYKKMLDILAQIKDVEIGDIQLEDAWANYAQNSKGNTPKGYTAGNTVGKFGKGDTEEKKQNRNNICKIDPASSFEFCDEDFFPKEVDSKRIDYIFVQKSKEEHHFRLEVRKIARRPLRRKNGTEEVFYLSDHLGIHLEFVVIEKSNQSLQTALSVLNMAPNSVNSLLPVLL